MQISVVIYSCSRARTLTNCLASLAGQQFDPAQFEVLVGIDGQRVEESMPNLPDGVRTRVIPISERNPGAARNRLINDAQGDLVVLLKDDVICEKRLLQQHMREQESLAANDRAAMVVGSAPMQIRRPDRLFDRVLRHSSMAFTFDRMNTDRPDRDWGYRHAWTLNMSVPRELAIEDGGFDEELDAPMYLDLVWARRMWLRRGTPVLYRPNAVVTHDHPMNPNTYLMREIRLGRQAYRLARHMPDCADEIFNCDLNDEAELERFRWQLISDGSLISRLRNSFYAWSSMPCTVIDGPDARVLMQTLYEQQLPLRRAMWRAGILFEAGLLASADIGDLSVPELLAA